MSTEAQTTMPTVLLVHGAFADSSSWNGVVDLLLRNGYKVRALPNTLRGLAADAAVISAYLKTVSGPVVLVGHSYGGSVISVASADADNVKALVYVNAFAPEADESIAEKLEEPPPGFFIEVPLTGGETDLYFQEENFGKIFASAESSEVAARLTRTQRPIAKRCSTDKAPASPPPGWRKIPSWYVLGEADNVIPPKLQEEYANRVTQGNQGKIYRIPDGDHPSMIAHPEVTFAAIAAAAGGGGMGDMAAPHGAGEDPYDRR